MSLPILGDANFEAWKQSLHLVASAMGGKEFLGKDFDLASLNKEDVKPFFTLANTMLNSLSERPRAIAVGSGQPEDITPFRMYDRLGKHFTPALAFNDLAYRREFFLLRYDTFGAIDLLAGAIQRIAAKIAEIEEAKAKKYKTTRSLISSRDQIAVLVSTVPSEFDLEVKEIEKDPNFTFEKR